MWSKWGAVVCRAPVDLKAGRPEMHLSLRIWLLCLTFLTAALLASCDSAEPPQPPVSEDAKVGFVFATSASNPAQGLEQKMAAQMAVDEVNATGLVPRLVPLFEGTEGKSEQAVEAFRKLINEDQVHAIIGPTLSVEAQSADPIAQKGAVPVLAVSNPAGGITDIGDYIFRASLSEARVLPVTVELAKDKLEVKQVCILYALDDPFSRAEVNVFRAELDRRGMGVLGEMTFSNADTDFKSQLKAIKDLKPDAIVVSALAGPAQMILRQARKEVGIPADVYVIGGYGFTAPQAAADPNAAEGLVMGTAWSPNSTDELSRKFVQKYTQVAGKPPGLLAAQAYAGVHILYSAIKRVDLKGKTLADARASIRDNLRGVSDFPTVLGKFSFIDKRDAKHPPVVLLFKNGKFEVVK
jgi:branched-chain amino acid transport system substrate-binding protein